MANVEFDPITGIPYARKKKRKDSNNNFEQLSLFNLNNNFKNNYFEHFPSIKPINSPIQQVRKSASTRRYVRPKRYYRTYSRSQSLRIFKAILVIIIAVIVMIYINVNSVDYKTRYKIACIVSPIVFLLLLPWGES